MWITARIDRQEPELAERLTGKVVYARTVKNATIVDLSRLPDSSVSFSVPPEINGAILRIDVDEEGSPVLLQGVRIVCGLAGNALRPYRQHWNQGKFSVPNVVVTVDVTRESETLAIIRHGIVRNGQTATIDSRILLNMHRPTRQWRCDSCFSPFRGQRPERHHPGNDNNLPACNGQPVVTGLTLPTAFQRYQAAVDAAIERINCRDCCHLHFAKLSS